LRSNFEGYDGAGKADLYWNFIIGAVHKYYDYSYLQRFFTDLQPDPDHVFYESLAWIGLENCAYEKAKDERPVLEDLRRSYATRVLRKEDAPSLYYLIDEIKTAHFCRVLGEEPQMRDRVINLLDDLEFDASMTTEQIVQRMRQVIEVNFPLRPATRQRNLFNQIFPFRSNFRFNGHNLHGFSNPFRGYHLPRLFSMGSADLLEERDGLEKKEDRKERRKKRTPRWQNLREQWDKKQRANIQNYYGASLLTEAQTKALEQALCTGNHKNCHLHFTRGEFDADTVKKVGGKDQKAIALTQREKNKHYYDQRLASNNYSIARLASVIRNTMLVTFEPSFYRAKSGRLVAGKIWRNVYLSDDKVFLKSIMDDVGNLSVDILLDASGSQTDRQEIIASQGYIIAESLTRCQIPVKVYAFCTNSTFTILNLFRDYGEVHKNDRIFNYRATGCNRDGLAIRTALHMLEESRCEHKVLIVLSDGKPVDPQGIAAGGANPDLSFYADAVGVNDTALEVRKGRQDGVSILCVFTGLDEEIPAAKKIYGNDLVCIHLPEKFADVVGVLIKNEFRNL